MGTRSGTRWQRAAAIAILVLGLAPVGAAAGAAAGQPAAPARDEFVPVNELPPGDQMPAAPLLIGAYIVAWVAVAGYVWSLWRRLGRVEHELRTLAGRLSERGR